MTNARRFCLLARTERKFTQKENYIPNYYSYVSLYSPTLYFNSMIFCLNVRTKYSCIWLLEVCTYNLLLHVFLDSVPVVVPDTKKAYQKPCHKYRV